MKNLILFAAFALLSVSCVCTKKTSVDAHNSSVSLDWPGYYEGKVQHAGALTDISIKVSADSTFVLTTGTAQNKQEKAGRFVWSKSKNSIVLSGVDKSLSQFLVQENRLVLLSASGKKMTSPSESSYYIAKDEMKSRLVSSKWVLVELRGQAVAETEEKAFVTFNMSANKINGNLGCNGFFGSFEFGEFNRLKFKGIGSTKKMCANMEVEDQLAEVFNVFDSYKIVGNKLQLMKGRMAPLAVFEIR